MAAAETAPALANELGGWFEAEFGPRADRWRSADYYVLLSRDGQLAERLGLLDSNPSHETSLSFIVEFRALRTVDPVHRSARDALIAEVGLSEEEVPSRRTRAPGRRELYRSVRDCRLTARDQLAKKLVSLIHDVEVHHRRAKGHRLGSRRKNQARISWRRSRQRVPRLFWPSRGRSCRRHLQAIWEAPNESTRPRSFQD